MCRCFFLVVAGCMCLSSLAAVCVEELENVVVFGRTREGKLFYSPGEKMTFEISFVFEGNAPTGTYWYIGRRCGDDGKDEKLWLPISAEKPIVYETSLDRPGFVQVLGVVVTDKKQNIKMKNNGFYGGAGVKIDECATLPEPADFDAFWARQKAKLKSVPVRAEIKDAVGKNPEVARSYEVRIDCAGPRPVTGYLQIPIDEKKKKYPIRVVFDGYGVHMPRNAGTGGSSAIFFKVNAHGIDLGKGEEFRKAFAESIMSNGKGYALDPIQNSDPEKAYFNGMALRVMRALEWVKTVKEWNGRDLEVTGSSQGGLQALWAAALDHDVTACTVHVPWCCGLGLGKLGYLRGGPEWVDALGYYDGVNMARRIPKSCAVRIGRAGLGDTVCPPTGIACLYNALTAPKRILWMQGSTHSYKPSVKENQTAEFK